MRGREGLRTTARHLGGVAIALAAWAFGPTAAAAQQEPSFPTLPSDLPAGQGRTQPCLDQVAGEAVCGRFRVWEDREARSGRTVDVAFVVLRALNDRGNTDAFVQFNGGPGAPTTGGAFFFARGLTAIREDRDILLVDHRGTGNSGALVCDNPFPGGIRSRFATVFPLDHIDACRDMLSRRADLTQYSTPHAMDDLAELMVWLGYTQLDLSGGSYGTREVQVFTRRHPDRVRTVVLNGVAPVDRWVYVRHARTLQEALDNVLAECAAQAPCHAAYPELASVLEEDLATVTHDPPEVTVEGERVPFGVGPFSYALRGLLYGQAGVVPAQLYAAHEGAWQPLAEYYLSREAWVGGDGGFPAGYHFSVLCAEDIDPLSWNDIARETDGTFMGDFLIGAYKRACERWPVARLPDGYFAPVRSDKPALLLSGGSDPVTPVDGATEVATGWPNALHVVVPNGGHGQGGPCIAAMELQLVRTGSVEGIDTSCVERAPPTRFRIGERGGDPPTPPR